MEQGDVNQCQFSLWYNNFKNNTFKSKVLDLPKEVTDYLLADGIVLPEGCEECTSREGLQGDSDDEEDWEDGDSEPMKGPSFPEFNNKLSRIITSLGGKVFPKLNWSSPKDAVWVTFDNTLKCHCPRDIYLLLKSSHFIMHDLTAPFDHCCNSNVDQTSVQYQLVLRRWYDVNPAGEFRCFVRDDKLIGICQRHHTAHFPSIPAEQEIIAAKIRDFFHGTIQEKFPLHSYVFDVYLKDSRDMFLVDFNPYGVGTDSLLFDWPDLLCDKPLGLDILADTEIKPVFRCIETEGQIRSSTYECYAMPQDFVHLTTGQDASKLVDFLQMKIQSQNDSSSSEDEEETNHYQQNNIEND